MGLESLGTFQGRRARTRKGWGSPGGKGRWPGLQAVPNGWGKKGGGVSGGALLASMAPGRLEELGEPCCRWRCWKTNASRPQIAQKSHSGYNTPALSCSVDLGLASI